MPTLRELTAETIGRITRRGLESQIAQVETALQPREQAIAVAPGHDGAAGVLVALTDDRLLLSTAAPFASPTLTAVPRTDISGVAATLDAAAWTLSIEHAEGRAAVTGMFDRDAQRIAALLS